MKPWQRLLSALVALLAFGSPILAAKSDTKGWALNQASPHGTVFIYVNKNGLAAVNKKLGCTMVTRAPKWNVVLYNDKTKVYYSATLAEWTGQTEMTVQGKDRVQKGKNKSALPKKGIAGKVAGIRANQYIINNPEAIEEAKKAELWLSTDMEVPPQIVQILGKTYGVDLSTVNGFPLKFTYLKTNGKTVTVLNTIKAQQQAIPMASFTYPARYKRVDNELLVFMDDKNKETIDAFLNDPASSELGRLLEGSSEYQYSSYSAAETKKAIGKKTSASDADLQKYMDLYKSLQQK